MIAEKKIDDKKASIVFRKLVKLLKKARLHGGETGYQQRCSAV